MNAALNSFLANSMQPLKITVLNAEFHMQPTPGAATIWCDLQAMFSNLHATHHHGTAACRDMA